MNNILNKMITHNFCLNSIETVPEDRSILKFKAVVMDFKPSHNRWAVSKDTAKKYMHTLVHKHIVAKYYSEEENDGIDALGDHEPDTTILRGSNGEVKIPKTNTNSIGTITKVYIKPLDQNNSLSEEVLWCEGILLAWDNINECNLLLEWANNNIPILASVEWYYTQNMIDNNGVEWIVNPNFSALTILNSEQRGNKDIVYGNYDCSHIELMLNNEHYKQFNSAVIKDISENTKRKGEDMDNIFVKALNGVSFGEIRDKVYEALAKVMVADEYSKVWISVYDIFDTYFIYEAYVNEEWCKFQIEYSKDENDEIIVNIESKKQVTQKEILVPVSEVEKATNAIIEEKEILNSELDKVLVELNQAKSEILNEKEEKNKLNKSLETIQAENKKLKELEKELNEIKYNERLENAKLTFATEFERFNSMETFKSEEVQSLIVDTLDSEKVLNATLKIKDILLECAKACTPETKVNNACINSKVYEPAKGLNNLLKTNKSFVDEYGFDING